LTIPNVLIELGENGYISSRPTEFWWKLAGLWWEEIPQAQVRGDIEGLKWGEIVKSVRVVNINE
jgi:hypothetical protein